jgi:hypothetical protein
MHKKTGLLDREAPFAEDLPSALQVRRQTPMVSPQEWREVSWADASGPEGILVREADGGEPGIRWPAGPLEIDAFSTNEVRARRQPTVLGRAWEDSARHLLL